MSRNKRNYNNYLDDDLSLNNYRIKKRLRTHKINKNVPLIPDLNILYNNRSNNISDNDSRYLASESPRSTISPMPIENIDNHNMSSNNNNNNNNNINNEQNIKRTRYALPNINLNKSYFHKTFEYPFLHGCRCHICSNILKREEKKRQLLNDLIPKCFEPGFINLSRNYNNNNNKLTNGNVVSKNKVNSVNNTTKVNQSKKILLNKKDQNQLQLMLKKIAKMTTENGTTEIYTLLDLLFIDVKNNDDMVKQQILKGFENSNDIQCKQTIDVLGRIYLPK